MIPIKTNALEKSDFLFYFTLEITNRKTMYLPWYRVHLLYSYLWLSLNLCTVLALFAISCNEATLQMFL